MDAVEFLKTYRRICGGNNCTTCPIWAEECMIIYGKESKVVSTVEQWAKEHPVKTRQSEFLKLWPESYIDINGLSVIYPCELVSSMKTECNGTACHECRKKFWLTEVE